MARFFINGKYLDAGAPGVLDIASNGAVTVAGFVYFLTAIPTGSGDTSIVSKGYDGTNTAYVLGIESTGPKLSFLSFNGSVHGARWTYDASFTTDTWHHVCGDYDGGTWHLNFNGVSKATSVDAVGPVSTTKKFYIGAQDANGTPAQLLADGNGCQLAHIAVWNAALNDAEKVSLSKGYCPAFVRPANLIGYWPIIGNGDPEPDLINANGAAVAGGGTTLKASTPPHIIMPSSQRMRRMTTTGGAATFPWAWAQGSNLPVLGTGNY